ncbi:phosphotransferase [Deinococcus sp. A31D244]|uniref:phosphotransferase n=1 Tax=Deinococcus sp. A31D244 TaxID=3397675 RepID=UPI0039E135AA
MSDPARRETTLHLLLTRPGGAEVACRILTVNTPVYYGEHVLEAARAAGVEGWLGRRLAFTRQGVGEDGVTRATCAWQLFTPELPGAVPVPDELRELADAARTPTRTPWFQAHWHAGALAWLDGELAAQGRSRLGDPVVLKHWQISLLWRVPTQGGDVYFKAVPDFFAREVTVTARLATEVPGAAPPVLAADTGRGFLLLDGCGESGGDPEAALRQLARVQRATRPLLPELKLRGRGPAYLLARLDALLSDASLHADEHGPHPDALTPTEAATLRARRPELEAALERLRVSPVPLTLGHGDLHGGNVTTRGEQVTLLDWSDASLTHPFPDGSDPDPAVLEAARDAYLREWTDLAPPDELRALHADALLAGEIYRALGYADGIQDAVEDRREWRGAHLWHLRRLLT